MKHAWISHSGWILTWLFLCALKNSKLYLIWNLKLRVYLLYINTIIILIILLKSRKNEIAITLQSTINLQLVDGSVCEIFDNIPAMTIFHVECWTFITRCYLFEWKTLCKDLTRLMKRQYSPLPFVTKFHLFPKFSDISSDTPLTSQPASKDLFSFITGSN